MDRTNLLEAIEAAANAERDYRAGLTSRAELTRALNHVAVCRDLAQCSFLRVVHVEAA